MLAGDIQHIGHDLIITGTSLDDTAEVYINAGSPSNPFDNLLVATIKQPGSAVLTKSVLMNVVPIGMKVTRIRFMGLNGNDKFTNYTAIATEAYGHAGNDTLTGGEGNDILAGGADNDVLKGNGGNDSLYGDAGADQLLGGAGNDTLRGHDGNDVIAAEDGDDYVAAGEGNDIVGGGFGNDTIYGEGGDDHLGGNGDNDVLNGGIGTDDLYGGSGNDTLKGGVDGKADNLYGGTGADTFHPEWYKDVNVWKNREKNEDYTPSEGDWVAGATNTPLFINFTQLDCLAETSEPSASDETYVVFWVGNLTDPTASYATRTPVFNDTDAGESKYATTGVWGANPTPIAAATDVVILAIVLENDSSDPNSVVSTVQAMMLPSLLAGIATSATRADLVAKLKTDMQGAVGLGVASGGAYMDEFSSAQELALTSANLVNARNGVAQDFSLLFAFDGGHYRVRFSMGRKN